MITINKKINENVHQLVYFMSVGSHAGKVGTLFDTIQLEPYAIPIQFYLNGNRSFNVSIEEQDINNCQELLSKHPRDVFVHSSNSLNLCKPKGSEGDYFNRCLIKTISVAKRCGFHGVVVHVGKLCAPQNSLSHMKANIMYCLESATPRCPLLIETPAGQGKEQLLSPAALGAFVDDIVLELYRGCSEDCCYLDYQKKSPLGICIDTCHVFAAGYNPVEYWDKLSEIGVINLVKLIHFNDSKKHKGSCVDRHAQIGYGMIPLNQLHVIATRAIHRGIPLVRE
jgi:deoxyribonuclease IV